MTTRILILMIFCAYSFISQAQNIIIKTIAGIDTEGYNGDNQPAVLAALYYPEAINLDKKGNLYIADLGNGRIRKITLSTGVIVTIAGTDSLGYSGDGGLATDARLKVPEDVFTDTLGNVYFADAINNRIRKIDVSTGIITTVAGNGIQGSLGDGGPATNAELNEPSGLCLDKAGNIFIADYLNNKVRKVDIITGIISTIAGTGTTGYTGNGGLALNATFNGPVKVFVDSLDNIYISDQWNSVVRKISPTFGIITTIAGNGTVGYSGNGGLAVNAQLSQPSGIYVDKSMNILFAEYGNGVIRKVDGLTGIISSVAGTGLCGFSGDGGPATNAQLFPSGVLLDDAGVMYIADYQNMRIRKVYSTLGVPQAFNNDEILVYPNPIHDELTIEGVEGGEMRICDLLGQVICGKIISSNKETISINSLLNGVYIVQVSRNNGERFSYKILKE